MSGPIPAHIADAAARRAADAAQLHALQADAARRGLSLGRTIGTRQREQAAERERKADTPAGIIWRGYSPQARVLLVMHAARDYVGNPQTVAMQPWGSFSDRDQASIGAMARELGREFADAVYLR